MKVEKQALIRKINASLIHHLEFEDEHEISEVPFHQLVHPSRFDVLLKYLYAKAHKYGHDLSFAVEAYSEHLRAWGDLVEGDLTGKDSLEKYVEAFNQMLASFGNDGFNQEASYIPVGINNIIIDGAHRSAACLACESNPIVAHFNHVEAIYDADFFRQRGLSQVYLDAAAIEYASVCSNSHIVSLFPIAGYKKQQVEKILSTYGSIAYEKQVHLFNSGPVNALAQMYKGEHWLGPRENGWPGALEHVKNKFAEQGPMHVYLYVCSDIEQVNEAKERIRGLFPFGNDSIHINDSHEETVRLAQQFFNENTIHLFNYGDLSKRHRVFHLHEIFKNDLHLNNRAIDEFCVDSSSILSLYGLREINDYDYLSYSEEKEEFSDPLINNHNHEVKHYRVDLGGLIFDPRNYLYYDGIKYSSLKTVLQMKENRAEGKDREDLKLANSLIYENVDNTPWAPLHGRIKPPLISRIKRATKIYLPAPLLTLVRRMLKVMRDIKSSIWAGVGYLSLGDRVMNYQGFSLYYSAGTSLVKRIRQGQIYKQDVTTIIVRELQKHENPVIIDVGANIGLISLNVVKFYPHATIYAFEPASHQRELFLKTIDANNLATQISVYDTALSYRIGMAEFSVHSTIHSSGDGFRDTNRAGRTRKTGVEIQNLDDWWQSNNRPDVCFVKIGAEGAELLILRGAIDFLTQVKPTLLLEINELNLRVYDYDHLDILDFLTNAGYRLQTLSGTDVDKENIDHQMTIFSEFMAKPIMNR